MTNSKSIAGLVGPTLVAITVSEWINLQIFATNIAPLTYLNDTLLFVGGLAIVRAHNLWTRGWPVSVTLVGWLFILGGLYRIFAPDARQGSYNLPTFAPFAALLATGVLLTVKG